MRGALLNKDWTASFKQATEKNSEYNFTFILRWNDLIYSAAGSEEREDQVRFLGNCPSKSYSTSSSFRLFMNFFAINTYNYDSVAIRRFKLERAPFARQMNVTDN